MEGAEMSKKRKHGKMAVPMSFSTRHFVLLSRQENRSAYIDRAIQHYDKTINWRARSGITEVDARSEDMKALLQSAKKHAIWLSDLCPEDFLFELEQMVDLIESWDFYTQRVEHNYQGGGDSEE